MTDPLQTAKERLARGEIDAAQYDQIVHRLGQAAPPERWWPSGWTVFGGLALVGAGMAGLTSMFWAQIVSQMSVMFVLGGLITVAVIIALALFIFINGI